MTVYRIANIHRFICLDADPRPATAGIPIGSRITVADTSKEEMFVGYYYASQTLPITDQPEAGDTIDIGCTTYTFVANCMAACEGDVEVGSSIAEAVANIIAAINGTDGVNTANADVEAEDAGSNTVRVTSRETGTAANSISVAYTPDCCSCAMNAFDGCGTLEGGYDEWTELP